MKDCWPCFIIAVTMIPVVIWLSYDFIHKMGRSK